MGGSSSLPEPHRGFTWDVVLVLPEPPKGFTWEVVLVLPEPPGGFAWEVQCSSSFT